MILTRATRALVAAAALAALVTVIALAGPGSTSGAKKNRCFGGIGPRLVSCALVRDDSGGIANPAALWGKTDCASHTRQQLIKGAGDPAPRADGSFQGNRSYRRLTVLDGDDVWGERCELARNERRYGGRGGSGTFALFREGQRRITQFSVRLPQGYRLGSKHWRVVMQMKQTQPAANGGGTPVLSLRTKRGDWQLMQSTSPGYSSDSRVLWERQARKGMWTRFSFDVTYSKRARKGSVKVYVDLNGDGDTADRRERSRRKRTYTLKREIRGGNRDGIKRGQSIPSHLRVGLYHDREVRCRWPYGCSVHIDNVQVLRPR